MLKRASALVLSFFCMELGAATENSPASTTASITASSIASNTPNVSTVLVLKAERLLRLLDNGRTVREYQISLGKEPVGHKLYEGDRRTPEGRYVLDWRNNQSKFYRSIHVSYPNARDRARSNRLGKSPGGNIMIHGIPNEFHYAPWLYKGKDWTDGCISVNNEEMDEIWRLVADGTPIVILP